MKKEVFNHIQTADKNLNEALNKAAVFLNEKELEIFKKEIGGALANIFFAIKIIAEKDPNAIPEEYRNIFL